MTTKCRIVMMSHLSDVKLEMGFDQEQAQKRIEFVKFLMLRHPNTDEEIDPDAEYEQFLNR